MFSKFTSMLHNAVGALAPNLPQQQNFIGHWKAVTRQFTENKELKVAIEQTPIPRHLEEMLRILMEEENSLESGSTGPCMEYLLQHKILETLYTLARTDCPPGMKQQVLVFFTSLLSKIRQPLLPHVSVHRAVHRLVRVCGEVKAGPSENEEIQFLCTVCAKLKMDPYLVNFFIEMSKPANESSGPEVPTFNIVNSLLCLLNSADARVAVKACEGLMLCVSLPEQSSAKCIVENTDLCSELSRKLCDLYEKLPKAMDPADIECVEANWGLDVMSDTEDRHNFVGKRALLSFLSWFDYCDQLVCIAEGTVAEALALAINTHFLQAKIEPAILQQSEAGATTATAHLCRCLRLVSSPRLLSVFVRFILGDDRTPEPSTVPENQHKVRQRLLERCDHLSDEMSITSLKLFETLLLKPDEHVIHNLVLRNLLGRAYYDSDNTHGHYKVHSSGDSHKSDSSPSRKKTASESEGKEESGENRDGGGAGDEANQTLENSLGFSDDGSLDGFTPPSSPVGNPSVHSVVNSFLGLVPDEAKSSYQTADSEYDTYLRDARRQFSEVCAQCVAWSWPTEALTHPDYQTESFHEGAFLSLFFDKITRMLDQSYDVNLQVTSVVSRLVMLPHPNLHEYLLNPMLPTKPGTRTLTSVIKKVVHDVETRMKQTEDFSKQLSSVRQQLMGMADNIRRAKARDQNLCIDDGHLLEGVIVLEEFCKELAAIACVKYYAAATI